MQTRLVNFYWVADAYDAPGTPVFQIAVEDIAETLEEAQELGGLKRRREALNMAQAAEIGLGVDAIGAAINEDVAAHRDRLADELQQVKEALGAAATENRSVEAERDRVQDRLAGMMQELAEASSDRDRKSADLDAANKQIEALTHERDTNAAEAAQAKAALVGMTVEQARVAASGSVVFDAADQATTGARRS